MAKVILSAAMVAGIQFIFAFAVSAVILFSVDAVSGIGVSERIIPYSNAHILEEAYEGHYQPLTDPVFLGGALLIVLFAFGASSYVAVRWARVPLRAAVAGAVVATLGLAVARYQVFAENYPTSMRAAYVLQLVLYIATSVAFARFGRSAKVVRNAG
jgi:hypothetical protein